jgi:hypothetical protein
MGDERGIVAAFLKARLDIPGNVVFGMQIFGGTPWSCLDGE